MNWAVCIDNQGYEASLEERKLYVTQADPRANALGMVRVIDESGSDYLYPSAHFSGLAVGEALEHQLLAA